MKIDTHAFKPESKELVIEFIDEPFTEREGIHYPSKTNPSSVWKKGKNIDQIPNDGKNNIEYIKSIISLAVNN